MSSSVPSVNICFGFLSAGGIKAGDHEPLTLPRHGGISEKGSGTEGRVCSDTRSLRYNFVGMNVGRTRSYVGFLFWTPR